MTPPFTPRSWQASALATWDEQAGLLVTAGVGSGKTWVGAQLAVRARRPLVLLPAAALAQTVAAYAEYGVPEGHVTFLSYTSLTRAAASDFLDRLRPDVLVLDEAHRLRNILKNSAAKRIERYLIANPAVRVCALTASAQSKSVLDWAHLALWALRRRAPVPPTRAGIEALDARLQASPEAREEFRLRLEATPGIVNESADAGYSGEVLLDVVRWEPVATLPDTWELPDGWAIDSPAHAAAVSKMLAWGWYPTADPRPSPELILARQAWAGTCRRVIDSGAADTPAQVAVLRPEAHAAYAAAVAASPPGESTPVWLSDAALARVPELERPWAPTIVWAHHQALQDRLAQTWRVPLHREGGRDREGVRLDVARAPLVVASIEACHAAHNAQHYSHSIVLEPPADPEVIRQLIGRTARQGQRAGRVTVTFVVNCAAAANALRTAIARAMLVRETTGRDNPLLQLVGKNW